MNTPAISIIVPIYNGEAYLRECLDSVLTQSFRNFQVVCINDGSTDGSAAILSEYAAADERFEVITQKNAGLSHSRNVGIRHAKGDYVQFLDCDDRLTPDALAILYEQAVKKQLDILYYDGEAFFDSFTVDSEEMKRYKSLYLCKTTIDGVLSGLNMFQTLVEARSYRASACLQFIRRAYILENALDFYEGIYYEDNIFTLKSMTKAQKTGYCHKALYERRVHADSIVTSRKDYKHLRSYVIAYTEMAQYALANNFPVPVKQGITSALYMLRKQADDVYDSLTAAELSVAAKEDPDYDIVITWWQNSGRKNASANPLGRKIDVLSCRLRNGMRILRTQGVAAVLKRLFGPRVCDKLRRIGRHFTGAK